MGLSLYLCLSYFIAKCLRFAARSEATPKQFSGNTFRDRAIDSLIVCSCVKRHKTIDRYSGAKTHTHTMTTTISMTRMSTTSNVGYFAGCLMCCYLLTRLVRPDSYIAVICMHVVLLVANCPMKNKDIKGIKEMSILSYSNQYHKIDSICVQCSGLMREKKK